VGCVGVAFSPLADSTPRAAGLRQKRQCGVPTLVLVTTVRQKNAFCKAFLGVTRDSPCFFKDTTGRVWLHLHPQK
jgi:hypothetical protein